MKYIDADKLIAEIESRKLPFKRDMEDGVYPTYLCALMDFEDIIDSLQQEQPDLPGIEESGIPGKDYIPVEWVDACEKYGKWKIVKQGQPEVDLEKEIEEEYNFRQSQKLVTMTKSGFEWLARHFYNLGRNTRKEK